MGSKTGQTREVLVADKIGKKGVEGCKANSANDLGMTKYGVANEEVSPNAVGFREKGAKDLLKKELSPIGEKAQGENEI